MTDSVRSASRRRWIPVAIAVVPFGIVGIPAVYRSLWWLSRSAEDVRYYQDVVEDFGQFDWAASWTIVGYLVVAAVVCGAIYGVARWFLGAHRLFWSWPRCGAEGKPSKRMLVAIACAVALGQFVGDALTVVVPSSPIGAVDIELDGAAIALSSVLSVFEDVVVAIALPLAALALFTARAIIAVPIVVALQVSLWISVGWESLAVVPGAVVAALALWRWRDLRVLATIIVVQLAFTIISVQDPSLRSIAVEVMVFAILPVVVLDDLRRNGIRAELAQTFQGPSWAEYRNTLT